MTIVLYFLFALSVFTPIYTYALYPLVLKLLKAKMYRTDVGFKPRVSAVIVSRDSNSVAEEAIIEQKLQNIVASNYPTDALTILVAHSISKLNEIVSKADGQLILFTDTTTELDEKAITNLVARFSDERIGCVCEQLRKRPDKDGKPTEGAFWKYENMVKRFESGIGRLSGANNGLYAVRKCVLTPINEEIISLDFYISTFFLQAGWDVVMAEEAVAYERTEQADGINFDKHVKDGAGYYQALRIFWKLLLPRKGSFTYVSHRVMKWFVWVNMVVTLLVSSVLACSSNLMLVLFLFQILLYVQSIVYWILVVKNNNVVKGSVGQFAAIVFYFLSINISYFLGCFKGKQKRRDDSRGGKRSNDK